MDNAIEYRTTKAEAAELLDRLKNDMDWYEIQGYDKCVEGDDVLFTRPGCRSVLFRKGVKHLG